MYQSNYEDVPVIGWATSGGGAASAYTGTAGLQALDDRVPASVEQRTGGLLQSLTYMTGLSGGSWPTISFALTNFPTVEEIVEIWKPWVDRYTATNETQYAAPFSDLFEDVAAKAEAGFDVGVADLLGRVFGYQFTPGYKGGLNVTMSSVVNQIKFQSHEMPMPILEVIQLTPNDVEYYGLEVPSTNQTIVGLVISFSKEIILT
jgi:lysophospholipase